MIKETVRKAAEWHKGKSYTREVACLMMLYNVRIAEKAMVSTDELYPNALAVLGIWFVPSVMMMAGAYGLTKTVQDGILKGKGE